MFELFSRPFKAWPLARVGELQKRAGIGPVSMSGLGLLLATGAAACLTLHDGLFALALVVFGQLAHASAFLTAHATRAARSVHRSYSMISLAILSFGFALADTNHALAACFLLFGLLVRCTALQAQSAMRSGAEQNAHSPAHGMVLDDAFPFTAAAAMAFACVAPGWFGLAAYGIGALGFVAAGLSYGALVGEAA